MTKNEYTQAYINARKKTIRLMRIVKAEIAKMYKIKGDELAKLLNDKQLDALDKALAKTASEIATETGEYAAVTVKRGVEISAGIHEQYLADLLPFGNVTADGIKAMFLQAVDILTASMTIRIWEDGYTFSERIWRVGEKWQDDIKRIVTIGLRNSRPVEDIAQDIQVYIKDGKIKLAKRYGQLDPTSRQFFERIGSKVDYRALRLVRSELYASLQEADALMGKINPGCNGLYEWVMEQGRQHWSCGCPDNAANGPYEYTALPDFPHPNCRCQVRPILRDVDEFKRDLQAWSNGQGVDYIDKWYNSYYNKEIS